MAPPSCHGPGWQTARVNGPTSPVPSAPPRRPPRWPWLALPAGALALGAATLWLATEAQPRVPAHPPAADAGAHLHLWLRQQDPRRQPDGRLVRLSANADELALLADQAARLGGGAALARLAPGRLTLSASLPLTRPGRPPWRWVNAELVLAEGRALPDLVQSLRIGRLPLPAPLARSAMRLALLTWDRPRAGGPPLHAMFQALELSPQRAVLHYRWRADLPQRVAGWLVPAARVAALRPYHDTLRAALRGPVAEPGAGAPALPALMAPLFALAQARSQGGADPAQENRAALLVLAAYASGQPAARWWPDARDWPRLPRRGAQLDGRGDFAQHFALSAALAAEAGGPLADALGLMKEVGDTRGGSGFSFTDIAVNRAGTRLGELAVREPRRVQALLAAGAPASALLPPVADLPEFIGAREFAARFGGVGAPAYEAVRAEIEARLDALDLYR